MPGGMIGNRNVDRENGMRARRGRNTRAYDRANRKIPGEFRLGAGLRHGGHRRSPGPNRTWSEFRSPAKSTRRQVWRPPVPQERLVAVAAHDGVGPVSGGVPYLRPWLDKFDWHARTASAPRLAGKRDCNNEPWGQGGRNQRSQPLSRHRQQQGCQRRPATG